LGWAPPCWVLFYLIFYINHRFFLAIEISDFRLLLFSYLHCFFFLVVFLFQATRTSPFGTWVDGVVQGHHSRYSCGQTKPTNL
jgi:hypothetical protein